MEVIDHDEIQLKALFPLTLPRLTDLAHGAMFNVHCYIPDFSSEL
jgi:hypothetical protein